MANKGYFIIAERGQLSLFACPTGLCLEGSQCSTGAGASNLTAVSCCAPDRRPAVDENGRVNLLCGECAAGLTAVGCAIAIAATRTATGGLR
jgi:hypothetical protein